MAGNKGGKSKMSMAEEKRREKTGMEKFVEETKVKIRQLGRNDDLLIALDVLEYEFSARMDNTQAYYSGRVKFSYCGEKEAKFFKCRSEIIAKKMWEYSSELRHETVLKLLFFTYCDPLKCWIVCYENFEKLLDGWLSSQHIGRRRRTTDDLLGTDFAISIGSLIEGIIYLHQHGIFHMGLDRSSNYVVISNKIKIINIGDMDDSTRREDLDRNDEATIDNLSASDYMGFKNLLRDHILSTGGRDWMERDSFLAYFDMAAQVPNKKFSKHLRNHPYISTNADHRMKNFDNIMLKVNTESKRPRLYYFESALEAAEEFDQYRGWNHVMSHGLRRVYEHVDKKTGRRSRYNGNSVMDLLRFLRNAYWHRQQITSEQLDSDVRRHYRDFLNRVYCAACRIYDTSMEQLHPIGN